MAMYDLRDIIDHLIKTAVDPLPNYILKKEILHIVPSAVETDAMHNSKWYRQLADSQWENGAWGRFHSMDSRSKQKFATTEAGLRRAQELGLTKEDPVVKNAIALMERYLTGEEAWPDYTEKHHDNGRSFLTAFPFLIAANLSLFDTENPLLIPKRAICASVLKEAFSADAFDEDIWERANRDYTGCCLRAWMVYPLWLMQNTDCLDERLQSKYLCYIWNRSEGIYYISATAPAEKRRLEDKQFVSWLRSLEVLCGFSMFAAFMEEDVYPHLVSEAMRLINGDAHLPAAHSYAGHYAESWRNKNARENDMILRIARILIKCNKADISPFM